MLPLILRAIAWSLVVLGLLISLLGIYRLFRYGDPLEIRKGVLVLLASAPLFLLAFIAPRGIQVKPQNTAPTIITQEIQNVSYAAGTNSDSTSFVVTGKGMFPIFGSDDSPAIFSMLVKDGSSYKAKQIPAEDTKIEVSKDGQSNLVTTKREGLFEHDDYTLRLPQKAIDQIKNK
ncbi:hypothetical protein [Lactococcus garvieae]|uniref:Uncharacterized protein n=1 Tax=Lactococcus garvieae TaxID=1363 RepID=A0A1I4GI29_9LACT|nr:hypothetical protein [Lactococcus garvieae]SFL28841.1 hypothetical protein SAMN05216438_1048 [Lactococcus garvieae]